MQIALVAALMTLSVAALDSQAFNSQAVDSRDYWFSSERHRPNPDGSIQMSIVVDHLHSSSLHINHNQIIHLSGHLLHLIDANLVADQFLYLDAASARSPLEIASIFRASNRLQLGKNQTLSLLDLNGNRLMTLLHIPTPDLTE